MKKKRSSCIHLLLISAAGVLTAGCDDSVRYTYTSREDCVREWGEEACEPDDDYDGGHSSSHSSRHYSAVKKSSARSRTGSISTSSIRRGGFGSSFRSSGG
ncbi:hypothetical protein [Candidatus Electronema sp. TJ]|uniref:hypothetical protein n=1 Tax=Candidatus Electronema sp. TJ TaxID=3401573 RepID=UPI003AA99834